MNGNDLMNALSGLDPKFIDEAAFELHGRPMPVKKAKTASFRKGLLIALPAAAAVLLTVMVALPALMRLSMSQSSAPAASDSSTYAPSEGAMADTAPSYDDSEAAYEAEEPMNAEEAASYEDAAGAYEAAEDTSSSEAMTEDSAVNLSAESKADSVYLGLKEAEYDNGTLTVITSHKLPEDTNDIKYAITGTDETGTEKTYDEGTLDGIITETDPLTLDISDLELSDGTYTLYLGEESIEFNVYLN